MKKTVEDTFKRRKKFLMQMKAYFLVPLHAKMVIPDSMVPSKLWLIKYELDILVFVYLNGLFSFFGFSAKVTCAFPARKKLWELNTFRSDLGFKGTFVNHLLLYLHENLPKSLFIWSFHLIFATFGSLTICCAEFIIRNIKYLRHQVAKV